MNRQRPSTMAVTRGPYTNSYLPSSAWVYSPMKSATAVSPSPATVIRSGNAASTSEVLPVPGGPYRRAGMPASRRRRSAATSGRSARYRGWYVWPFGRRTGPRTDAVPPGAGEEAVEPGTRRGAADRGVAGEPPDVAAEAVLSVARYRFGRLPLCAASL